MTLRETLYKTVKCPKNHKACIVQDTVLKAFEKCTPDQVTHQYKCRDFFACPECTACQYHQ
jgi:hypothetical protein